MSSRMERNVVKNAGKCYMPMESLFRARAATTSWTLFSFEQFRVLTYANCTACVQFACVSIRNCTQATSRGQFSCQRIPQKCVPFTLSVEFVLRDVSAEVKENSLLSNRYWHTLLTVPVNSHRRTSRLNQTCWKCPATERVLGLCSSCRSRTVPSTWRGFRSIDKPASSTTSCTCTTPAWWTWRREAMTGYLWTNTSTATNGICSVCIHV